MGIGAIIVLVVIAVVVFFLLAVGLGLPIMGEANPFNKASVNTSVKNMVTAQRNMSPTVRQDGSNKKSTLADSANVSKVNRVADSRLTMEKKLKYAQWKIPAFLFRTLQVLVSVLVFILVSIKMGFLMQFLSLFSGPLFMNWLLNKAMDKRFIAFDRDYAPFLLSLVGLLKTGMNPLTAIGAAAEGLEDGSLLKIEAELMLERLKLGTPEDQSIGAFAEDVYHPEIELFVQALLLSRRVGGNLSDTLDRLARQVRKRQFFRQSAVAAVAQQRGSIWVIVGVLVGLEVYLYYTNPDLVLGAFKEDFSWQVWQFGVTIILLGIFLIRQVTKIRV